MSKIDEIYKKGLELLDTYYKMYPIEIKKKYKKRIYKFSTEKKCEYPDCQTTFIVKGGGQRFCKVHAPIMLKEAKRRGWNKQNEIRSRLLKLSKKEK